MYVNIFATINTGNTTFSYVHDLRTQIESVGGWLNKQNIVVSPVFNVLIRNIDVFAKGEFQHSLLPVPTPMHTLSNMST